MDVGVVRSRQADEAAVRAVEESYDTAWNRGDVAGILGLLTEDVVIIDPYGETTAGRADVERFFEALFDNEARGSTHTSRIRAVRFVSPDVALVDADAVISDFGTSGEDLRHDFADVLVRTSDGWRIDQVRAFVFMPKPEK